MAHEIFIGLRDQVIWLVVVQDGAPHYIELASSRHDATSLQGRIYLAQVERVIPRLQAAFVNLGTEKSGFLGAREARYLSADIVRDAPIEDCLEAGDEILVQITRPPIGEKGAQLTTNICLPGRAMVISPCQEGVFMSRAIEDETERARLRNTIEQVIAGDEETQGLTVEGMDGQAGWIVRTAAADMDEADIKTDMHNIATAWENLLDRAQESAAPLLLHKDADPIAAFLRDQLRGDTKAIIIEGDALFRRTQAYCKQSLPAALDILTQSEEGEILFDRYDVNAQIDILLARSVPLSSGANLIIETTEAMTTIDVNAQQADITALEINLQAAQEIAQQIQRRNLGGLIAIDFIDMNKDDDNKQVCDRLKAGFAQDRTPVRIGDMSDFGVIEMTRRGRLNLTQSLALIKSES